MYTRKNVLFSGAALGLLGPALLTKFVDAAQGTGKGDIAILNSGIELERAGIKAYQDAAGTGLLSKDVLAVAAGFMHDHQAHRDALIAAVKAAGATPSDKTVALTYPALKTQTDILQFAKSIEEKAAATYLSVIPELANRELAGVAASILGVETTHVALLAQALGSLPVYPSGFVS